MQTHCHHMLSVLIGLRPSSVGLRAAAYLTFNGGYLILGDKPVRLQVCRWCDRRHCRNSASV